jgi:endogenous inhibitor of DNA gyrase (YacG/DUF329 family)
MKRKTAKAVCPACGRSVEVYQPEDSPFRWLERHRIPNRKHDCRLSRMPVDQHMRAGQVNPLIESTAE